MCGLFGNILQPDECRMLNGKVEALQGHAKVERVIYPTLFDDLEQVAIYKEQCDFPGGMFSIVLKGVSPRPSTSCGISPSDGMRSLSAELKPWLAIPTPPRIPASPRRSLQPRACRKGLVRISVGIEDWRDLLADFEQALER
jgi:cystathionine beta-lyase/cystathionine gamma-synthase